jgi:potassium-dependent mechanosensitive channel
MRQHSLPVFVNLLLILLAPTVARSAGKDDSAHSQRPAVQGAIDSLAVKRRAIAAEIARLSVGRETASRQPSARDPDAQGADAQSAKVPGEARTADKTDAKLDETKLAERLATLRSIDTVYAQHQKRLERCEKFERQTRQATAELEALDKFSLDEPKPYSFLLLEDLADQSAMEADREAAIKADLKSSKQLLQAAHEQLDSGEVDSASESSPAAAQETPHRLNSAESLDPAALPQTLLRAQIGLRQAGVESQTARLGYCQARQELLEAKIKAVKQDVKFSAQDRDKQLERFARSEAELKQRRSQAETHFESADAKQRTPLQPAGDKPASERNADTVGDAYRDAADACQAEIVLLDQRLDSLANRRRFWKQRYTLASSENLEPKKVSRWLDDLDDALDQLKDNSLALEERRNTVRAELSTLPPDPSQADEAAEKAFEMRRSALEELRDTVESNLDDLHVADRALRRFRTELKANLKENSGSWTSVGGALRAMGSYQVAKVDGEALTVGTILMLVAYIVGGIILAYTLSRLLGRRLLTRLGVHHGTVSALKSIVFYILCVVFGVLSFQLLHVPLAAFAFLGGAAAIAVGFGSQDIMNNFMSGIILLVEQPIRVGDIVQLDSVQGVVLHIGLRSTRLQTELNHELIVPNKSLLDEQVTNLTLSDNFVQTFVSIEIDRSEDVQAAKQKMLEVVFLHPMVIKSPRPVVLLKEADTYWLTFEVHFSLEHGGFMKCAIVQSQVLEQISALFMPKDEDKAPDRKSEVEQPGADGEASAAAPDAISEQAAVFAEFKKLSNEAITKGLKRTRGALKIKA